MPNQPKTPNRTLRVEDELWKAARAAAEANGENISDVVRRALRRYVRRTQQPPSQVERHLRM